MTRLSGEARDVGAAVGILLTRDHHWIQSPDWNDIRRLPNQLAIAIRMA